MKGKNINQLILVLVAQTSNGTESSDKQKQQAKTKTILHKNRRKINDRKKLKEKKIKKTYESIHGARNKYLEKLHFHTHTHTFTSKVRVSSSGSPGIRLTKYRVRTPDCLMKS